MRLQLRPSSDDLFAPYGRIFRLAGEAGRPINEGTSRRSDLPAALDLLRDGGVPTLAVFEAQAQGLAGPWRQLERHRYGSQTFIPLQPVPWVVLVARAGQRPEPATLAAFLLDGSQGVTLHPGTWHHPLIALEGGRFLVLERAAAAVDCDLAGLETPVTLVR